MRKSTDHKLYHLRCCTSTILQCSIDLLAAWTSKYEVVVFLLAKYLKLKFAKFLRYVPVKQTVLLILLEHQLSLRNNDIVLYCIGHF